VPRNPIIACELLPQVKKTIENYADELVRDAHTIGSHGLTQQQFQESGIFRSALERLRGIQAASMAEKRAFMEAILDYLQRKGKVRRWKFTGAGERHDYQIKMPDGRISIVETKGCLDGNNTNIFERPPNADEFVIWSLCQNPGSDPRKNAWSGIHTRLGAEVIHRRQKVDGVVIWDMVCGTPGRPCPKLQKDPARSIRLDRGVVPPPCIYLFPRSIPDPRSNPDPPCWSLTEVRLLQALHEAFKGDDEDVVQVHIEARMSGSDVERRTRFLRHATEFSCSSWSPLRRARA